MVTVVAVDENGIAIPDPIQDNLQVYLDSMREINFIVNTMDPVSVSVDVTVDISVLPGYDPVDVAARVSAAIDSFLDPSIWGIDPTDNPADPKTWNNTTTVYYLELATAINNVGGVDRITQLVIGLAGGSLSSGDVVLSGVVPLPSPGTVTVTTQ